MINAFLLWHFENKSQIDDLQEQIQHQDIENIRLQNKIESLRETAQAYQNESKEKERVLIEKQSQLELKKISYEMIEAMNKCRDNISKTFIDFKIVTSLESMKHNNND